MHIEVVHQVPGRARLRIAGLRHDKIRCAWIEKTLTGSVGLARFRINVWCECLILEAEDASDGPITAVLAMLRATAVVQVDTPAVPGHALSRVAKAVWHRSPLLLATAGAIL